MHVLDCKHEQSANEDQEKRTKDMRVLDCKHEQSASEDQEKRTKVGNPSCNSVAEDHIPLLTKLSKYLSQKEQEGPLTIYKRPEEGKSGGVWKFGIESANKNNKVIMFVGETGSGKSSLINTLITFIFGLKWEDNYRIKLIDDKTGRNQAHSQTQHITTYQINPEEGLRVPYSITLIDTPGFGDTRGIIYDGINMRQIRAFFGHCKFLEMNAICFVISSSQSRLTPTQKYVYDNIVSIFGKDMKDNIVFFTTFADWNKPNVLSAITEANLPCARTEDGLLEYFKVNNAATYANNCPQKGEDEDGFMINQIYWKMGMKNSETFFCDFLNKVSGKDLTLTNKVLQERNDLEVTLDGLIGRFRDMMYKEHELENTKKELEKHQEDVKNNQNYEIEVEVAVKKKVKAPAKVVNCRECEKTCYRDCNIVGVSAYFIGIYGFGETTCNVCQHGKNDHFYNTYYWETCNERQKIPVLHIKEKYDKSVEKVVTYEEAVNILKVELVKEEKECELLIRKISESLKRLQEIALLPNPMSLEEYLQLHIETEKMEGREVNMESIQMLEKAKRKCAIMAKIKDQGADLKLDVKGICK
ncbi:uncharacterized protein [Hyperolius riggenbachi]|uniref:uncharacterized protein n=1 Tax=Hyperolius riggenbachi TaxID=752182 RepID=UPI0035A2DCC4